MRPSSSRACLAVLLLAGASARAVEPTETLLSVETHGFISQGFLVTTDNNFLAQSQRGSFEFTEAGINFSKALTDKLRVGLQLFARDLGPLGNYSAKFDWFHLDYRWSNWLGVRAGRVKLPFGLYNDTSDIDSARVPVLLPQSVYPAQNRDFLLAQTGVELYGYVSLGGAGALDYRLFAGTIFLEVPPPSPSSPVQLESLTNPYVVGGRVLWEAPLDGLRVGASVQSLRLDTELLVPAAALSATVRVPALLWVASAEYVPGDLQLAVEYSRWHVRAESSDPAVFPETGTVSERGYALVAYRVNRWFQPSLYYSLLFPDAHRREAKENVQHDVAATARFDLTAHWLLKLEAHYLHGTALLTPALNDGQPLTALNPDWALFLVKTTASF